MKHDNKFLRVWFVYSLYRKKKAVHKANSTDDKRLQAQLKRMGVNTIPGIEEVAFAMEDGSVQVFNTPKVQASIAANTYVVAGPSSVKTGPEALASMMGGLGGLGGMTQAQLQQLMAQMGNMPGMPGAGEGNEGAENDDDDVPELVGDFEQTEENKE